MDKRDKYPGIRCPDCGCRLDPGEQCDCERIAAERKALKKHADTQAIIAHNLEVVEQAMLEWDYA